MTLSFTKHNKDYSEIAFIVTNEQIIQKIYCSTRRDLKNQENQKSKKNPELQIEDNTFTLPEYNEESNHNFILELSPYTPENQTLRITVVGASGTGKTYFMGSFLKRFVEKNGYQVIMFTTHKYDPSIDKRGFDVVRVNIDDDDIINAVKYKEKLFDMENLAKSFVLFDDTFDSQSKLRSKFFTDLSSDIAQNSRKYDISSGYIIHNTDYSRTRMILSEATHIVLFLNSSRSMNKRIMKTYLGLEDDEINYLLDLDSRYLILKNSAPLFLMTETQIFTQRDIKKIIKG